MCGVVQFAGKTDFTESAPTALSLSNFPTRCYIHATVVDDIYTILILLFPEQELRQGNEDNEDN